LDLDKRCDILLLSLVLLSCIVAPNRDLANTLFFTTYNTLTTTYHNSNIDMEVHILRERSVLSSANVFRESSAYSSVSSISYDGSLE